MPTNKASSAAQQYSPQEAYRYCLTLTQSHYENFPVASLLLPRKLRQPITAIYAFARSADDFADEGELPPEQRLARLDDYAELLHRIEHGESVTAPIFIALQDAIQSHGLPIELFHALLSAFRQDVTQTRYATFNEVLDYCRRSANPVGRLLLHLNGEATEENLALSDNICTALQLINFLQDIAQDFAENNRIYLPMDEMSAQGVTVSDIAERRADMVMYRLFHNQLERARALLLLGSTLGERLSGRFGLEIRLIIQGGLRITDYLGAPDHRLYTRPRLSRWDYLRLFSRALRR